MKWIVLAILVGIGAYTFLTLKYRKPGHAFEPYSDLKDRANTKRLLDAGYQRVSVEAVIPSDPTAPGSTAAVASVAGGLPPLLREKLIEPPALPVEIVSVAAAPSANALMAYPIGFRCTLPDNKQQLAGADLYVRGDQVVIAPDFDRLAGGLLSRTRESTIRITVPAGVLKPGEYHITLLGARTSKSWTLQVH